MVKTFKKIAALAMAIALVVCFAVSASADVTVDTTTTYVTGDNSKVNVSVNVQGATGADYITYYATNGSTPVYIDQAAANGGAATFNFQTAATNLDSTVKVGYTGADAAENEYITANTISASNAPDFTSVKLPTAETTATVTVPYAVSSGKTVGSVSADNATVGEIAYDGTNITVPLSAITGDVVLTVNETEIAQDTSVATILDAAGITDGATRKFTVLGAATGTNEYGVIISKSDIADVLTATEIATLKTNNEAFEAKTSGTNGVFAVQIIDEATEDAEMLIKAGEGYYVAVYVKTSNSTDYKVAKLATAVTVQ